MTHAALHMSESELTVVYLFGYLVFVYFTLRLFR